MFTVRISRLLYYLLPIKLTNLINTHNSQSTTGIKVLFFNGYTPLTIHTWYMSKRACHTLLHPCIYSSERVYLKQFTEMRFGGKYNHWMGRKHPIRHQISIREREKEREMVESAILYYKLGSIYWCILKRKTNLMQC